jgi:hypothetical protein
VLLIVYLNVLDFSFKIKTTTFYFIKVELVRQYDLAKAQQHIYKYGEDPLGTYDSPTFSHPHPKYGNRWLNIEHGELSPLL